MSVPAVIPYVTSHRGQGFQPHAFGTAFQLGGTSLRRALPDVTLSRAASTRRRTSPAPDVQMGSAQGPGRYGSAARSPSVPRHRERSPSRQAQTTPMSGNATAQAGAYRDQPAGPQEQADWSNALEAVLQRVDNLERTASQHAHTIAAIQESAGKNKQRCEYLYSAQAGINKTLEKIGADIDAKHVYMDGAVVRL